MEATTDGTVLAEESDSSPGRPTNRLGLAFGLTAARPALSEREDSARARRMEPRLLRFDSPVSVRLGDRDLGVESMPMLCIAWAISTDTGVLAVDVAPPATAREPE